MLQEWIKTGNHNIRGVSKFNNFSSSLLYLTFNSFLINFTIHLYLLLNFLKGIYIEMLGLKGQNNKKKLKNN